jgi:hypothetical protein
MLGVKTVQVMFDQDEAGQNAASYLIRTWNAQLDGSSRSMASGVRRLILRIV